MAIFPPLRSDSARPRLWGLLLVLASNMLIDAIEVSAAIVVLPKLGSELQLPIVTLQWVMSGFAIGFGGLMLFANRVVAVLGRRHVYLAALLAFAAASVVGGLAQGPQLLIASRFVKGFSVALAAPTGLAIINTAFPDGPARSRALSVYTLFGALGFTAGLLLSGLLTEFSWRCTFLFPAPIVVVLFACGLRLVPSDDSGSRPRRFDTAGAFTFIGALAALVRGIVSVPAHGWMDLRVLGALVASSILLIAFVAIERHAAEPLLRLSLLTNGVLVRSAVGAATLNGSYLGLLLVLTFQLQSLMGWTPLRAALALLPASVPLGVTSLFSGRMVSRFGTARLIALGAFLPLVAYALCLRPHVSTAYVADILPTLLLVAAGFVLAFAALNIQSTSDLPISARGMAIGVYQTAVQMGAAIVIALVSALLASHQQPPGTSAAAILSSYRPALWLVTAVGGLGLLVSLAGVLSRPATAPRTSRTAYR